MTDAWDEIFRQNVTFKFWREWVNMVLEDEGYPPICERCGRKYFDAGITIGEIVQFLMAAWDVRHGRPDGDTQKTWLDG